MTNKRSNISSGITRIFLMVLLAIVADQAVESVLLENIAQIQINNKPITHAYLLLTMPFALILAAWSDFHCRRKTMIFALTSLSLSAICIYVYKVCNTSWVMYASLIFKGVGGNVTPVAFASLATIVPARKFTLYLAIAICAYSLGLWVPIYLHSFEHLPIVSSIVTIISTAAVIFWFRESEFDDFQFQNNLASLKGFFNFFVEEIFSIIKFGLAATVLLALLGFLASEVSYYQILLRGEVLQNSSFYSELSLKMGISYYLGTFVLYLLLRKKVSVIKCLVLGTGGALLSVIFSSILNSYGVKREWVFDILFAFYSIGYALLTPSLFSLLSRIRKKDEQGKIYGFLDTYDTLAAFIGIKYIGLTKYLPFNNVLWLSCIIIFVSTVLIVAFIRDIKDREGINLS